jgi:hypothetical protein
MTLAAIMLAALESCNGQTANVFVMRLPLWL